MRWNPTPLDDVETWPLSMTHLDASKLGPNTGAWRTDPIRRFLDDADAMIESTQARRTYPGAKRIPLPAGRSWRMASLWSVLRRRRTVRRFARRPLDLGLLGRLLGSAAGVTGELPVPGTLDLVQRLRAWPSAGAIYPIELYASILDGPYAGAHHYDPVDSCLETLVDGPIREVLAPSVMTAEEELSAPVVLVLSAVFERTMRKYGERGYRFVWLDAGHLAQNLILAATALGLACCTIGGFHEAGVAQAMRLDSRETVIYLIAVGHAARSR